MDVAVDHSTPGRVFITYAPGAADFAEKLHHELQRYRPPTGYGKLHVYKDEPDFVGTDYYAIISDYLLQSDYLLVICSEEAPASEPLRFAAHRFLEKQGMERVILLRYGGPVTDEALVPEAVARAFRDGFTADFSAFDPGKDHFETGEFHPAWISLLSQLFGIKPAGLHLWSEQLLRTARYRKIVLVAFVLLTLLTVAGFSEWSRRSAAAEKERRALLLNANQLVELSLDAAKQNHQLRSMYLALEAMEAAPVSDKVEFARRINQPFGTRLDHILEHGGQILGARLINRESQLLTWSNDNLLRIWDFADGRILQSMSHNGWVYGAELNADESLILSWGADSTARLWHSRTGQAAAPPFRHRGSVLGAVFNTLEDRVLTWSEDGSARLWDVQEGRQIGKAMTHEGWVSGARWLDNERRIFTWSTDSSARFWNAETGDALTPLLEPGGEINGNLLLKNQKSLIIWGTHALATIWDRNGRPTGRQFAHNGPILGARLSRDESRLLTWGYDNTARLWYLSSGTEVIPAMRHNNLVFGAVMDEREERILTWSYDNTARIWDVASGAMLGEPMRHSSGVKGNDAGVFGGAFLNAENAVLTWGDDNTARIWDAATTTQYNPTLQHRNGHDNRAIKGALVAEDHNLLFTWSNDSSARVWKLLRPFGRTPDPNLNRLNSEELTLYLQAFTGTEFDSEKRLVRALSLAKWQQKRDTWEKTGHRN